MKLKTKLFAATVGLAVASASAATTASLTENLANSVTNGKAYFDFRYRYENVDQANITDQARASTLRSRVGFDTAAVGNLTAKIEFDNVTVIGSEKYNSTVNSVTAYPVVADPKGTNINQVYLTYSTESADVIYGRQRINYSNQRFVGGVAWRQNEQTFDGLRGVWRATDRLSIDYSYAYKVHRIFGPNDGGNPPALRGANSFLYVDWNPADGHRIGGFGYFLDFDPQQGYPDGKTVGLSSDTLGLEYVGRIGFFDLRAAYAQQEDSGKSFKNYRANYYLAEGAARLTLVTLKVGYEVLGSDNGVGFATPLATLHKFQGWADKFLGTPGDGIKDFYLGATGKAGPIKLGAFYHDFQAEDSREDFGSEIDLVATWPINKRFSTQLKYADFNSDSIRYDDTRKFWLTLQFKL